MVGDTIMAFDYKKEYKEFYMPKNKPSIVESPKMNYIIRELEAFSVIGQEI